MAIITLGNPSAELSGKNVLTEEGTHTITGPLTFDRDPSAPFIVSASSAVVTNLNADMVDGIHAADLGGADNTGTVTVSGAWTFSTNPTFNADAIPETAIADGAVLARVASTEAITGDWTKKAGTSSSSLRWGGTLKAASLSVGNVGTGEDTLLTYTIPANVLATDYDSITFEIAGVLAGNTNGKVVKIKYGGTTLVTSTSMNSAGHTTFRAYGTILRTGSNAQNIFGEFTYYAGIWAGANAIIGTAAINTAATADFVVTGEATSNDDIILKSYRLIYHPASA